MDSSSFNQVSIGNKNPSEISSSFTSTGNGKDNFIRDPPVQPLPILTSIPSLLDFEPLLSVMKSPPKTNANDASVTFLESTSIFAPDPPLMTSMSDGSCMASLAASFKSHHQADDASSLTQTKFCAKLFEDNEYQSNFCANFASELAAKLKSADDHNGDGNEDLSLSSASTPDEQNSNTGINEAVTPGDNNSQNPLIAELVETTSSGKKNALEMVKGIDVSSKCCVVEAHLCSAGAFFNTIATGDSRTQAPA